MVIKVQTSGMRSRCDSLIKIKRVVFMIKHVIITCDPLRSRAYNNTEGKEQINQNLAYTWVGKKQQSEFQSDFTISAKRL